jgi:hypothetical protein
MDPKIWDACCLHGSLIFAVLVGTGEHYARGRGFYVPWMSKVDKTTLKLHAKLIAAAYSLTASYVLALIIYAPTGPFRALVAGFLIVPFVSEGRITRFIANQARHGPSSRSKRKPKTPTT